MNHRESMRLADEALLARLLGETDKAVEYFRRAFQLEVKAADALAEEFEVEPTRSVVHRSAATLALECGEYRAAERLVSRALVGEPPAEVAEELRTLLERVNFHRHLELRGLSLADDELQVSLTGRAVSAGMASLEHVLIRIQAIEKAILRTGERLAGFTFREAGRPRRRIKEDLQLFLSAPRTGSLSITLKVGTPERQLGLPGLTACCACKRHTATRSNSRPPEIC